jgi:hypothetical protein
MPHGGEPLAAAARSSSWIDYMVDQHQELLEKVGITNIKEQASLAWSLFTQDKDTIRKNRM